MDEQNRPAGRLRPGFSPLGIWAFSIGTSIGWGSFIVTCSTYLQKSGLLGTVFGLLLGMAVILVITWNLQYMIRCLPDAGGVYSFEKRVNGKDFGFLAAWFVLLIPGLLPFDAMETESYILFIVWALLGLGYFRYLIRHEENHEHGQRVVVWVILLMLVLFASMMWVSRKTETAANEAVGRIFEYHQSHPEHDSDAAKTLEREMFLQEQANQISSVNTLYSLVSLGLFLLSTTIMLNNYEDARKLGQRLTAAEQTATKDALTGVKNRTSYAQYEREFNERIADDVIVDFALALCDINDLKTVNDTLGHAAGDECIRSSCMLICKTFKHCPVFRLGGDEFAVFLRGEDYNNRAALLEQLRSQLDESKPGASLSIGLSEFVRGRDKTFHDVLARADALMYEEKKAYKARHGK